MKTTHPPLWHYLAGALLAAGITFALRISPATAQPASIPAQTYGRMTLAAATATKVPTTCMTPRYSVLLYNLDAAQVCCGGDANVTCTGTTGGYPIVPGASASIPINCDGSKGVIFCFSSAGTAANALGWWEIR